jgi:hypothetical protein
LKLNLRKWGGIISEVGILLYPNCKYFPIYNRNMKKPNLLGITLTTLFFVTLFAATPFVASASAPKGCFVFTVDGDPVGKTLCDALANDITVKFTTPDPNCVLVGSTGQTEACPTGANNLEVTWGPSATGPTEISKCLWTKGSAVIGTCPIAGSTKFTLTNTPIKKVFWTHNGNAIKVVRPPVGVGVVNDVEFFII